MKRVLILLFAGILAGYGVWRSVTGYKGPEPAVVPPHILTVGKDTGLGNLVGIQPYMIPPDYASGERFEKKMDHYLDAARQKGFLNPKSIVVLPEYLGTWLLVEGEKGGVYTSPTTTGAMVFLVLRHPFDFLRYYVSAKEKEADRAAIFRVKSADMARTYQRVFSALARKYNVTIVAGSILLADPKISPEGTLEVNASGRLYNVTAVFDPQGKIQPPLVKKIFPVDMELKFMDVGTTQQLPVFSTPAGRLGVLVCADSWYPKAYEMFRNRGVQFLAIPSDVIQAGTWSSPWQGYNPGPPPADVDPADVGKVTEADAWKKYSMGGRASALGIESGVNVFLRGTMWDLSTDGRTLYLHQGQEEEATEDGELITNVWIEKSGIPGF